MANMWAGRFKKALSKDVNDFNSSISVDGRMYREDIRGSVAHATMLKDVGIIGESDAESIIAGLNGILADLESGALEPDPNAEDIHMFVEAELTKRIGAAGKRLHTARSRNDQVTLDTRLYLREECARLKGALNGLIGVLVKKAEENKETVMPGYTHLQRAQPVTFAHHLLAYAAMFIRDAGRIDDAAKRMNELPLGSLALAGTTYPIDRDEVAELLGFDSVCMNSMDGVSDRDYVIEIASAVAIAMMHLSRFAEEIILWCSWEFKFLELDDAYSTGSSIMPQKKNPDVAELVRGKTGRAIGNLVTLLTMMKGLPLAYNKDMQEDKEAVFDSIDTLKTCLNVFAPMLDTAKVLKDNMLSAAGKGFINATDCADYLVKKGMPFREAYKLTGELVAECIDKGKTLETLDIAEYKAKSELFDETVYDAVNLQTCVEKRTSYGAPSVGSVEKQLKKVKDYLNNV